MALVTRDPFAREELHRTRVTVTHESCAWCGQRRMTGRTRTLAAYTAVVRYWLYRFRVETDGGRVHEDRKLFCSRDCRTSYHG